MTRDEGLAEGPPAAIRALLSQLNEEVLAKLVTAGAIRHPGESGRARENIIRQALGQFVPDAFELSSGFVVDGIGGISRQIDIVIYRRGYHPVFVVGDVPHFMVESVAAVIESKAAITSTQVLLDALDALASVKRLDRTNRGSNYVVHGGMQGAQVDPTTFGHQIHSSILTEASLSDDTLTKTMWAYLNANSRAVWPNLYVDVTSSVGSYLTVESDAIEGHVEPVPRWALTDSPERGERWVLTRRADSTGAPPFVRLLSSLANFLRISELIDYQVYAYFPRHSGPGVSIGPLVGTDRGPAPTASEPARSLESG